MELSNTFRSLLTPEDFKGDNFAEGIVIEPEEPAYFNNGSRVYFKNKTQAFSEKNRQPREKKVFELSEKESDCMNNLLCYNTPQRVENVISKIGKVEAKDFGKILGLTIQDMLEDYKKDYEVNVQEEVGDVWKQFCKILNSHVQPVVREVFVTKLD
jgi:Rnl2 family RNA ligase